MVVTLSNVGFRDLSSSMPSQARQLASVDSPQPSIDTTAALDINQQQLMESPSLKEVSDLLTNQLRSQLSIEVVPQIQKLELAPEAIAIRHISHRYQQGLNEGKQGEALMKVLDQSAQGFRKAYQNTGEILNRLGMLGAEQQSFISRSESQVEGVISRLGDHALTLGEAKQDDRAFELAVKTQEGDIVTVRFSAAQAEMMAETESGETVDLGTQDSFELSYEVEGELSEQEHQALQQVFAGVGELADNYFKAAADSGWMPNTAGAELSTNLLAGFDTQQLAGVELEMGVGADEFNYSYQFDNRTQQQHLSVERMLLNTPMQFEITTSTYGSQDQDQLAQLLSVLDANADEAGSGFLDWTADYLQQSSQMYADALTSMFELSAKHTQLQDQAQHSFANGREMVTELANQMIRSDERYQSALPDTNALGQGVSKLADFSSSFSLSEKEASQFFSLTQEQQTEQTQVQGQQKLDQSREYSTHIKGDYAERGTQEIEKAEQYQVAGLAELGALLALDEHHDSHSSKQVRSQVDWGIYVDETTESDSETSSQVRLIEGIWSQDIEQHQDSRRDFTVKYGDKPVYQVQDRQHSDQQYSILMGEKDKLNNADFIQQRYLPKLSQVNQIMDSV